MALLENPKKYIQKGNNTSFPMMKNKEHDDFKEWIEQTLIENIDTYPKWEEIEIWLVENLPTTGLCNDNIYAKWYRDNFKVSWDIEYSKTLYEKWIAVVITKYNNFLKEDGISYDLKEIEKEIKKKIDYFKEKHKWREESLKDILKKFKDKQNCSKQDILEFLSQKKPYNLNKEWAYNDLYKEISENYTDENILERIRKESEIEINFPNIENIVLVSEEIEDSYSTGEIIWAMRTWTTERSSDSSSILEVKWKKINLTENELAKLNNEVFKVKTYIEEIEGTINKLLWA